MFNLVVLRFLLGIINLCNSGIIAILPFSIVENDSQGNSTTPVSYRLCEQYPMEYVRCPHLSKNTAALDFSAAGFCSFVLLVCDSTWMLTAVVEIFFYVMEKNQMKFWYGLQITLSSLGLTFAIVETSSFYTYGHIEYNYRQALAYGCSILSRVLLNYLSWTLFPKNRHCMTSEDNAIERPNNASLELQALPRTQMSCAGRREHNNLINESNSLKYLNERRHLQMSALPPPVPERGASLKDKSVDRSARAQNNTNCSKALKLSDVEPIAGTSDAGKKSNDSLTSLTEKCDEYIYIESEETFPHVSMDDENNNDNDVMVSVTPPAIPARVASLRDEFTSIGKHTAISSDPVLNSIYAPQTFVASASVHTKKISKHEEHTVNESNGTGNITLTCNNNLTRILIANGKNNKSDFLEFPPPPSLESTNAASNTDTLATVYEDVELGIMSQVEGPKNVNMYDTYYEPVTEL